MMIADVLVPNRHQDISHHHAEWTATIVSQEWYHAIFKSNFSIYPLWYIDASQKLAFWQMLSVLDMVIKIAYLLLHCPVWHHKSGSTSFQVIAWLPDGTVNQLVLNNSIHWNFVKIRYKFGNIFFKILVILFSPQKNKQTSLERESVQGVNKPLVSFVWTGLSLHSNDNTPVAPVTNMV